MVIVGVLILSGAVNTSLIGVNGVMNRVAEDGVLLDWFRRPHSKFGTTYRILNLMAVLQILTIIASRGDVLLLGEAYAFGVVWSFALKALGVLVLRYQRHDQEYKFPGNITLGKVEIPIGLAPPLRSSSWSPSRTSLRKRLPLFMASPSLSSCTFCSWSPNKSTLARKTSIAPIWKSSTWITRPRSARTLCTRGPAASWSPSAITAACGT